jgi:uncharacterized protein
LDEATQPTTTPAPTQDHGIEWILAGKNGVRAGWGIALFIILFILFLMLGGLVINALHLLPKTGKQAALIPRTALAGEAIQVTAVFFATVALALIERKPIFSYGYQGTHRALRFASGLVWGFVALSVLVLLLWKTGFLAFDGQVLHGFAIWKYAAIWGLSFLGTGFFEESLLRGYVQFTMARGVGFWWGALLFSFLFGFIHTGNPGESPVGVFQAGAIGLVFCISLWYTGSLWWAVGFHAAWDWSESYFFGTSDSGLVSQGHLFSEHPVGKLLLSGGTTGPEGSLLGVPLVILIGILMILWWGRRAQSPFAGNGWMPEWVRQRADEKAANNLPVSGTES